MRFPGIVLTAFLPVVLATTDSLRLHHRIYHPSLPSEPFTERGALLLADSGPAAKASLVHSDTLQADLSSFLQAAQNVPQKDNDGVLYQLALEHPGDTHHSQWHVSAVKACHLFQSTSETITLHLAVDGKPFAIDYFVTPIPHNGACPKKRRRSTVTKSDSPDVPGAPSFALGLNSTVLVRAPTFPPLPQLRTPPPLTAEGKPFEVPHEKTFLQKYWIYIVVALVALALSPGAPEEEEGQGGAKK